MLDSITAYIEQYGLFPEQGTIIVAVSGGADSLCLLHILHRLCGSADKRYPKIHLHVAHLNHQLRGTASDQDAAYVAQLAHTWGLPITIGAIDVPALARQERQSLEEAARTARYRFLRQVAHGQPIAVAHHADDQVETLLLHWLRGGALASMVGMTAMTTMTTMAPRQHDIIRPLLASSHAETVAYCQQHNLLPLEDASNTDTRFLRNRIRHELLPLLTSMNPGIRATLLRNAEVVGVDVAWIEQQVDQSWPMVLASEQVDAITLHSSALQALPLSLQRHLLRRATARLCAGQSPLELRHYLLLERFMQQHSSTHSTTLDLPGHLHLTANLNTLRFDRLLEKEPQRTIFSALDEAVILPIPGRINVAGTPWIAAAEFVAEPLLQEARLALSRQDWPEVWRILPSTRYTVYIDGEHVGSNLQVRTRRPGDRIRPLGMAHEKKVQDVLVNQHIPRADRATIPLFFSASHCLWVAGIHIDDRVRLTPRTQHILHLSITIENP